MRLTDEQFSAAKLKDSRAKRVCLTVGDEEVEVAIRPATRGEWKSYKALANNPDENKSAAANEQLLIFTALSPAGKELNDLLDRHPAAADVIAGKVKEISGLTSKVEVDL